MTDPTSQPASDTLAQLRARAATLYTGAADWLTLGQTLQQEAGRDKNRLREALAALTRAYQIDPSCDPTLLESIARTAFIVRDWALLDSATSLLLAQNAGDINALAWRAATVQQRNDFNEAERLLREAARVAPGNAVVLLKLALCVKEQARFAEAEILFRRALELSPDNAHARFDLSDLEIRSGRYAEGWANYEARIAFSDGDVNNAQHALAAISPHWRGESLTGKTLIVYGEQGNGDCLWAIRFLALLAERARREAGRVIFGIDGPLRNLCERMLPADITLESSLKTTPDFHCGLMSLPLRLGIVDPAGWGGRYLSAESSRVELWRSRVAQVMTSGRRKVGLVWNGNPEHTRDTRRSIPDEQLEPLLTVPGITYFALSPGRTATVEQWQAHGVDIVDLTRHFDAGWDDVAALLVNLDLMVTIDSGPAHLAGALGVPTCLMIDHISAWFWGTETRHTPWYDSIELFRQPAIGGAWGQTVARVRERLEALTAI